MRHLLMTLVILASASSAVAETLDYTGYWAHLGDIESEHFSYDCGGYFDAAVKGNFAYGITGYGLQIIDCSNPATLVHRGFLSMYSARRCAIRDHYLYVTVNPGTLIVVDVDEHDAPVIVGEVDIPQGAADLAIIGPWLYMLRDDGVLQIFGIADAVNPQPAGAITLPDGCDEFLVAEGGTLYAAGDGGLAIVGVSLPDWPTLLGTLDLDLSVEDLAVRDGIALVGGRVASRLVDVQDPASPQVLSTLPDQGLGVLLTSTGEAWLGWEHCWHYGGARIYDVSEPGSPQWRRDEIHGLRGWPETMIESQGHVFLAEYMCWCAGEWPGFHTYRLGALPLPQPLATREVGMAYGLVAHDSYAYLATDTGLQTWDVADPFAPELMQTSPGDMACWLLAADGDLLVTVGAGGGSYWLQLATRGVDGMLGLNGILELPNLPVDIAVSGDLAAIAYGSSSGVSFVDVSDRDAPAAAGTMLPGHSLRSVALHGNTAAFSFGAALRIFDVSDLADPVRVAILDAYQAYRPVLDFVTHDGRPILMASRTNGYGLEVADIFDLSNPAEPVLLAVAGQLPVGETRGLALQGEVLAVSGQHHLSVYRWDPDLDRPIIQGRVEVSDEWLYSVYTQVAITSNALVLAHQTGGLQTWPLPAGTATAVAEPEMPPAPAVLAIAAVPNPFNPACELRFELPADGSVILDVFDPRGRRVRRLLDENRLVGHHTVTWNGQTEGGRQAPTGIYLARLQVGGRTATVKLTLVE